jgi:DNA primase catalytic core
MSVIDEVKQKTDIAEIIGQYATLKKAGKNLTALCPFHSEKHPSFFVYPEQQSWHCFGACNTGGDVLSFIMRKESMDFGEALRLLADRVGVVIPTYSVRAEDKEEKEEFYKVNEAAALYYNNLLINSPGAEKARAYVENRGFSSQTISDFQLGFSLDSWEELKKYLADKGYSEENLLAAGLLIQASGPGYSTTPCRNTSTRRRRRHSIRVLFFTASTGRHQPSESRAWRLSWRATWMSLPPTRTVLPTPWPPWGQRSRSRR